MACDTLGLGIVDEVGHAGDAAVGVGAAQLLDGHVFVGDRLHHVRSGHEHVAHAPDHEDEVGDRGGVHRAAGAGAEDRRDLGDDARGEGVAEEDVGVAAERDHALLDAGAARVVEADHRRAVPHREVHDLADLLGVRLGERAAEDGEVLGEDVDQAAVDPALSGDDAVAGKLLLLQTEIGRAVGDEAVELDEAAFVEQEVQPLAGGELALLVLLGDPIRSPALFGEGLAVMEVVEEFAGVGHRGGR